MTNTGELLTGQQAMQYQRRIDWIVVYPHSSNIEIVAGQLEPRLSIMSEMSVRAAVEIWNQQPEAKIIFPGETCFIDTDLPDTTDLMIERAKQLSVIDDDSIVGLHRTSDGHPLNNTYLQTQAVAENLESVDPRFTLTETLNYHIERVMRTAKRYGLKSNFAIAEDVLHVEDITGYDKYLPAIAKGTQKTEILAKLLTINHQHPGLINLLMERAGARLVDVVEDEDGEIKFVNELAKKKLQKLQKATGHNTQTKGYGA